MTNDKINRAIEKLIGRAIRSLPLHVHDYVEGADFSYGNVRLSAHPDSQGMLSGKKTVFVGMSGGVDSSVSAYLLKCAGFNVIGVFIKTWQPEGMVCTWKDDRRDAMRVCAHLGIPFRTLDLEDEYKRLVADYMINEYRRGRTPNPDIMCNKHVKFGGFFKYAMDQGADFVATGHYAQTRDGAAGSLRNSADKKQLEFQTSMVLSQDEVKDQTYFLWAIGGEQLPYILFPVGGLLKDEVRMIAEAVGIPIFDKKDSQGVCFIGKLDMKDFLKDHIDLKSGPVYEYMPGDRDSDKLEPIGNHDGVELYTIGERRGFVIFNQKTDSEPQFVIRKDIPNNALYVGTEKDLIKSSNDKEVILGEIHMLSKNYFTVQAGASGSGDSDNKTGKISGGNASSGKVLNLKARIRHRQSLQDVKVTPHIGKDGHFYLNVYFTEGQKGLAPGQSCVLYDGDICLGGGIIQ